MKRVTLYLSISLFLVAVGASHAQLIVAVSPPKIVGQKAMVALEMRNSLAESINSARASLFLLDQNGKMLGQSSKWVIGGSKDIPGLAAGATNTFNFVITADKPFTTTNLTATISFSRVLLESGKLADATTDVQIQK